MDPSLSTKSNVLIALKEPSFETYVQFVGRLSLRVELSSDRDPVRELQNKVSRAVSGELVPETVGLERPLTFVGEPQWSDYFPVGGRVLEEALQSLIHSHEIFNSLIAR